MKRLIYSLLAIAMLLSSCRENVFEVESPVEPLPKPGFGVPVTEVTENFEVTYQYKDGVILLDDFFYPYIESVQADTVLYISDDIPLQELPVVGDVLSSRMCEELPHGLAHGVLSVTPYGDTYKVVTTQLALDQVFEVLEMKGSIPLEEAFKDEEFSKAASFDDGNGRVVSVSYVEDTDDVGGETRGNDDEGRGFAVLNIKYDGKFTVAAEAKLRFDLVFDVSVSSLSFSCYVDVDAEVKGEAGFKGDVLDVKEYELVSIKPRFIPSIQVGPVTLRPQIGAETSISLNLSGKLVGNLEYKTSFSVGAKDAERYYNEKKVSSNDKWAAGFDIGGEGSIDLCLKTKVGVGLFTSDNCANITPRINAVVSGGLNVLDYNLFRNVPTINFDVLAAFALEAKVNMFFYKNDKIKFDLVTGYELYADKYNLLPQLVENSLSVKKRENSEKLIFDAKYTLDRPWYSDIVSSKPKFMVSQGNGVVQLISDYTTSKNGDHVTYEFEIEGLDEDMIYVGRPVLEVLGFDFEHDGTVFSSTTPTVAVTDIVYLDYENGEFYFNNKPYSYRFDYYVNIEIKGSENCSEWGLYDKNSLKVYNPLELKDGRVTMYWDYYSNSPQCDISQTPYAVLKATGEYKYYETYTRTLTLGGFMNAPSARRMDEGTAIEVEDGVLVLKSVVWE